MSDNLKSPVFPESLHLGIPDLDEQHETFFAMLARVGDAVPDLYKVLDDDEADDVLDVLADLRDYALEHFGVEEGYMREVDYHDLSVQKAEHNRFISDVTRMEAELMNGTAIPAIKIHTFMHEWLEQHITEHDRPFGDYYHNNKKK